MVGVALLVFCVLLLCVSAWWNRGIADEVTMASYGRAVTGTAVMARSANEEKKKTAGRSNIVQRERRVHYKVLSVQGVHERDLRR